MEDFLKEMAPGTSLLVVEEMMPAVQGKPPAGSSFAGPETYDYIVFLCSLRGLPLTEGEADYASTEIASRITDILRRGEAHKYCLAVNPTVLPALDGFSGNCEEFAKLAWETFRVVIHGWYITGYREGDGRFIPFQIWPARDIDRVACSNTHVPAVAT